MRELDFVRERHNLEKLQSAAGPRFADRICIPESVPELCTERIVTMTYLDGPKLEEEVLRRFAAVGIDRRGASVRRLLSEQADKLRETEDRASVVLEESASTVAWSSLAQGAAWMLGPTTVLWLVRGSQVVRDTVAWATCSVIDTTDRMSSGTVVSTDLRQWVRDTQRELSTRHTETETRAWLDTLLDVHGFQVFLCPLFNSDPHPGNIIVMPDGRLGLIDYGQCSTFTDATKKRNLANFIIAVADDKSDADIADAFRAVGIQTQNSSDFFTASIARLMFGHITPDMLRREWHRKLRETDKIQSFPPHLIMVYRVAALLRGLGLALHHELVVSEAWRVHAYQLLCNTDISTPATA
eukprot:m.80896 g.80896  ORF g.80896 m.80896 type:complete len:355 (+) comp9376_c1_seq1:510-1574(+)